MDSRGAVSIRIIAENKRDFMPLLLLGDENESYINAYLKRGDLFALCDGDLKSVCVVTDEGGGVFEIQNIATDKRYQRQGYASQLIDYIATYYAGKCNKIILGTGDVPGVLAFYRRSGFKITHRLPDYFIKNYDSPITTDGVLLKDKVYLERKTAKNTKIQKVLLRPYNDGDYALMERWLQMPHIAKWYKHPDHWLNELKERHGEFSFLTHFIVEVDGKAIGFCQYYDTFYAQAHEVWNDEWQIGEQKGEIYSIDIMIGELEYLGKGYGKQMVAQLIKKVWKLGARKIIVEPEKENEPSNGTLKSCGFMYNGRDYFLENPKLGGKN